jgi:hypothetical protein
MNRVCYGCYSKGGGTFQVGSANWGLDYGVACSNLLLACLLGGSFNNYVDKILSLFDLHLSPLCVDSFYTLSVDKNIYF